jgi:hypothetical protein
MYSKTGLSALAVAAATFIAASSAQAVPTYYDNLIDFNNALGSINMAVEDFEGLPGSAASPFDFGRFTITTADDIDRGSNGTNGSRTLIVDEGSDDYVMFAFDDVMTAFRIDVIDALDTLWKDNTGSITVTIDGGSPEVVLGPMTDQLDLNLMFIGVIDLDGFNTVKIDGNDTNDRIYYDNMRYGPVAIAEPATLAMFGLGLAGLGFARRRRTV